MMYKKYNADQFIIKMFLVLTDRFPKAQNLLLINKDIAIGEIQSFLHRAIKFRFNTLFIISISDKFPIKNIYITPNLL